jgi:hypothetical protein
MCPRASRCAGTGVLVNAVQQLRPADQGRPGQTTGLSGEWSGMGL